MAGSMTRRSRTIVSKVVDEQAAQLRSASSRNYQRLIRLEVEKHHAVIESAAALDGRPAKQLLVNLRAKYGKDLTTEFKVSPELIGGLRIKIGSDVFDSSVRERLTRLESEFTYA